MRHLFWHYTFISVVTNYVCMKSLFTSGAQLMARNKAGRVQKVHYLIGKNKYRWHVIIPFTAFTKKLNAINGDFISILLDGTI